MTPYYFTISLGKYVCTNNEDTLIKEHRKKYNDWLKEERFKVEKEYLYSIGWPKDKPITPIRD